MEVQHIKDFKDKVVVIPGGATGIGFGFAKAFGAEGAKIVLAARRENRLQEAAAKLEALGVEVCTAAHIVDVQ